MSDEVPPDNGGLPYGQTQRTGQRWAMIIMGAVVVLIAVTVIGLSQAAKPMALSSAPHPDVTPTFRSQPLTGQKATVVAQMDATFSATWTAEAAAPTPTFTTGIFPALQDKFATFYGSEGYEGQINGTWEIVRPGTEWPTPVADYSSPGGYGAVRVYNAISLQLIGDFPAPDHSTWLDITAVKGDVLWLKSDKTASLGFDMTTNTFTS